MYLCTAKSLVRDQGLSRLKSWARALVLKTRSKKIHFCANSINDRRLSNLQSGNTAGHSMESIQGGRRGERRGDVRVWARGDGAWR